MERTAIMPCLQAAYSLSPLLALHNTRLRALFPPNIWNINMSYPFPPAHQWIKVSSLILMAPILPFSERFMMLLARWKSYHTTHFVCIDMNVCASVCLCLKRHRGLFIQNIAQVWPPCVQRCISVLVVKAERANNLHVWNFSKMLI